MLHRALLLFDLLFRTVFSDSYLPKSKCQSEKNSAINLEEGKDIGDSCDNVTLVNLI